MDEGVFLEALLREYDQVHEEIRLYMRRVYWVIFYYPIAVAGIIGLVQSLDPAFLPLLVSTPSFELLASKGAFMLFLVLLFPIASGAIQFFGLYWLFRELRATAYLSWLSGKIKELANKGSSEPPLWHSLPFGQKMSAVVELLTPSSVGSKRVARSSEILSILLTAFITHIPILVSLAIIGGYIAIPALHSTGRTVIASVSGAVTLLVMFYAGSYEAMGRWLEEVTGPVMASDEVPVGQEAEVE